MYKSAVIGFFSALLIVGAAFFFGIIGGHDPLDAPVAVSAPVSTPTATPTPTSTPVTENLGAVPTVTPEPVETGGQVIATPEVTAPTTAPTNPGMTTQPAPVAQSLTPCADEDSVDCYWDAESRGNGYGRSFTVDADGNVTYGAVSSKGLTAPVADAQILTEDGTYVNPDYYAQTAEPAPLPVATTPEPILTPTAPEVASEPVSEPVATPTTPTIPEAAEPVNVEPELDTVIPGIPATEESGEISSLPLDTPVDPATVAPTE